ncbi:MAG: hypothetical protein ABL908_20940 [Hyphomicrobium sp.]
MLDARRDWRDAGERLLAAFDGFDFGDLIDEAGGETKRVGHTQRQVIVHKLSRHLSRTLALPAASLLEAAE